MFQSWSEVWADHGVELSLDHWKTIIGTDAGYDPWTELQARLGRRLDPDLLERRRARRDELQAAYGPREGVVAWLDQADALRVPVAVASSSPVEWVAGHLSRLGLSRRFSLLVCKDEVVPAKPDPTSFRRGCAGVGADPGRSVAVEDSSHGVTAAVAAGLFTVAVPNPLTESMDLSAADVVVPSLERLVLADVLARAAARAAARRPTPGG